MADLATTVEHLPHQGFLDRKMKPTSAWVSGAVVLVALLGGLGYIGVHIAQDLSNVVVVSVWPYVLLGVALLIALGFEFVNGFHDTANAVATVIYTHSLDPNIAVVWSGMCNLAGVLASSGAVAFSVITLLPVELILKVSYGAGFAMVFALLIAAIIWNLGTWWFGLPASSSHTMVGSIIGVGVANQVMSAYNGTSGVDWGQAGNVFRVLLISPVVGFCCAAILFLVLKPSSRLLGSIGLAIILGLTAFFLFKWSLLWTAVFAIGVTAALAVGLSLIPAPDSLFRAPEGTTPPPWPIRALLILTCSGVSYFHGSNDGQKGMGLIMLILIGAVPTAYALNHAVPARGVQAFVTASQQADQVINKHVEANAILGPDARAEVTQFVATKQLQPDTMIALRELVNDLSNEVALYKEYKAVPANQQTNVRNDMYVVSEAIRLMVKNHIGDFSPAELKVLNTYKTQIDMATKFIPGWVKVAVALALGLGTMVGWKRIVVTVGERIGKEHMTYAQGASAGLITMATIFAADTWSLPVSTTHILSSGVAGTMAANGSGLRLSTVRNIAAGWVLTLPAAALLSGSLYLLFHAVF